MSGSLKYSIGFRLLLIAGLSILLLIPAMMVDSLITEREQRRNDALKENDEKWGLSQVIAGPVLTLPYKKNYLNSEGSSTEIKYIHILPDNLNIKGTIQPEIRYRGIYKSVLYNARVNFEGIMKLPDFAEMKIQYSDILWDEAFVSINISDMKGIKDNIKINWDNKEVIENPGLKTNEILESGVSNTIYLTPDKKEYKFTFDLNINGSDMLSFLPIGRETKVWLSSKWANPSFAGNFLPVSRDISDMGFTAEWKVLNLNRNYPQYWIGNQYKIFDSGFGVRLLLPIDEYQKTMRTSKYSIMFIGLTFLAFFVIEVMNRKILHPVQYLLIGFAIVLFYTLLLAFSEYIEFTYAYWIAAIAIAALISTYTRSILSSNLLTVIITGILLFLYAFLFVIMQLQDFALLLGSIGLFIILGIVMFITRRIDWYAIGRNERGKEIGT